MLVSRKIRFLGGLLLLGLLTSLLTACSAQDMVVNLPAAQPTITQESQSTTSEVEGVVQALSANSLTVNGQTFNFDPQLVAQTGVSLQVGSEVKLQTRSVNGATTVVQIVVKPAEDTPEPSPTSGPISPTVTPVDDHGHDANDDHGRTPEATEAPGHDQNEDGNRDGQITPTATAAPRPTVVRPTVPRPTVAPRPTEDQHGQGDTNHDSNDDRPKSPTPTAAPQPTTPKGDDHGRGGDDHKTPTAGPRPTTPDDNHQGQGGDDHKPTVTVRPPATPTAAPTRPATPTPQADDHGHDGGSGGSGDGKGSDHK